MFVSIILDTEYMGMAERFKWFLKNISHAKKMDAIVITHEYIKTNQNELLSACAERFYEEFEMERVTEEEMSELDIYYIPDSFFEKMEKETGTRSKAIVELSYHRNKDLEKYIESFVEDGLSKRGEKKVDGIFNCIHCLESIDYIAKVYQCPVIPYVFSAIRKVHGYTQTLYMANMSAGLMNNDDVKKLYDDFEKNKPEKFELLTKKEILALIGKQRNLPLLPLLNQAGKYELGVAEGAFRITPQLYHNDQITEDDIYYEARKKYDSRQIISRIHPILLDQMGIGRRHMQNDPVSFILSCKRIAAIHSQIVIKAALWNRVPCVFGQDLPYSFLLSEDIISEKPLSDEKLNFILFCYFIPNKCMFDREYWLWRMERPSAKEIYERHIHIIIEDLGYESNILRVRENRLRHLLGKRLHNDLAIDRIINDDMTGEFDYDFLLSKLTVQYKNGECENYYTLNYVADDEITSEFYITSGEIEKMIFVPLDGSDGFVKINKAQIGNDEPLPEKYSIYTYCNKGEEKYVFKGNVDGGPIAFSWNGKRYDEYIFSIDQ